MARNFDLAALRSFLAVADTGGVTRAAQRLHLTQSAVSMQLKRLEENLGVGLLNREGRGVALTRQGEELAAQARRLIDLNDEIWRRMTTPVSEGEIRLGVPHDIVYPFAPIFLRRFNKDSPNIRISLVSHSSKQLLKMLEAGDCDAVLTTEFETGGDAELLVRRDLKWIGAIDGEVWRRRPVPLAFEQRCIFRQPAFDALDASGHGWDWAIDAGCFDAHLAAVAADLAVCALMEGVAPPGLEEIDHGGALPDLPVLHINLYLAKGPNAELAERLATYIREAYRETKPSGLRAVRAA